MEKGHGAYFNRHKLKIGRIYQAIISVIKYLSLNNTRYRKDSVLEQPFGANAAPFRIERTLPFFL